MTVGSRSLTNLQPALVKRFIECVTGLFPTLHQFFGIRPGVLAHIAHDNGRNPHAQHHRLARHVLYLIAHGSYCLSNCHFVLQSNQKNRFLLHNPQNEEGAIRKI